MPKIRFLKIRFNNGLHPHELPSFRAAVIEHTGREHSLFHNHKGEHGFHYRYPLIQYKVDRRRAGIVCLNGGADDIHHLLRRRDLTFRINERQETYEIEDVRLHYFQVQTWQGRFHYHLHNWLPFSQQNFHKYQELTGEIERLEFLQRILTGNILAFAKGIDWWVEEPVEVTLTRLHAQRTLKLKGLPMVGFSLDFQTNVSLPDHVGLGKGVSVGFGNVMKLEERSMPREVRRAGGTTGKNTST